ncbi:MAG: dihydroxy-acid dehydratase [Burkholderiaceae bacterium]
MILSAITEASPDTTSVSSVSNNAPGSDPSSGPHTTTTHSLTAQTSGLLLSLPTKGGNTTGVGFGMNSKFNSPAQNLLGGTAGRGIGSHPCLDGEPVDCARDTEHSPAIDIENSSDAILSCESNLATKTPSSSGPKKRYEFKESTHPAYVNRTPEKPFRSQRMIFDPERPGQAGLYCERQMNGAFSRAEIAARDQSGELKPKPIIGIAMSGSDANPCNRVHEEKLKGRYIAGVRDAGGIPVTFYGPDLHENWLRPTAAIYRNLESMNLHGKMRGNPFDVVIGTIGCDKNKAAFGMAALGSKTPFILVPGGTMDNGYDDNGKRVGSGTHLWNANQALAAGNIDETEHFRQVTEDSAPSLGNCNPPGGTGNSMSYLAEALGWTLPGSGSAPATSPDRSDFAYYSGRRAVEMAFEGHNPCDFLTKEHFLNAIMVMTLFGASSNAPIHLQALAETAHIDLDPTDLMTHGYKLPLTVNGKPGGKYLGADFHRAGGVQALMHQLKEAGYLYEDCMTVTGETVGVIAEGRKAKNRKVIRPFDDPMMADAGFVVLDQGNLIDYGILKTWTISQEFRDRHLSIPGKENIHEGRAIVFDGSEDYHRRIKDPKELEKLQIDESCILVMRGAGPKGWPGSAEVANMDPPAEMIRKGLFPMTLSDGRTSGTCKALAIVNCSETLGWLQTDDIIRVDLNKHSLDALVEPDEIHRRKQLPPPPIPESTWGYEELYRKHVLPLSRGGVFDFMIRPEYRDRADTLPRHNH